MKKPVHTLAISLKALIFAAASVLLLIIALLVVSLGQAARLDDLVRRLGGQGVEAGQSIEQLRQSIFMVASDMNKMRSIMNLAPTSYPILARSETASGTASDDASESENPDAAFFTGIDYVATMGKRSHSLKFLAELRQSPAFSRAAAQYGLVVRNRESGGFDLVHDTHVWFSFMPDAGGDPSASQPDGSLRALGSLDIAGAAKWFKSVLPDASEHARSLERKLEYLGSFDTAPGMRTLQKNKYLSFGPVMETGQGPGRQIKRRDGSILETLLLRRTDAVFALGDLTWDSPASLLAGFPAAIDTMNVASANDLIVEANRKRLADLSLDSAFSAVLAEKGLVYAAEEREDNDYYYHDLATLDGRPMGSYAVQKWTGAIWVMGPDDIPLSTLDSLDLKLPGAEKKN